MKLDYEERITYSPFAKVISAFIAAIIMIGAIEAATYYYFKPSFWERTAWFVHNPYQGEHFDRTMMYEKLSVVAAKKADIITVGDSSGFFSHQPEIINRYLDGHKVINLSTGANHAVDGFLATAEYALKRNPSIKYVVYHMYPCLVPSPVLIRVADLGRISSAQFNSIKGQLEAPPSAMFSYNAKLHFFMGLKYNRGGLLSSHKVYLEAHKSFPITDGWIAEHDVRYPRYGLANPPWYPDVEDGLMETFSIERLQAALGLRDRSTIIYNFQRFATLCRKYNVKPIISFQQVHWYPTLLNPHSLEAAQLIERFSKSNPDVAFIVPFITIWDSSKFGMFNHTAREYAHLSSARIGKALGALLRDPEKPWPFTIGQLEEHEPRSVPLFKGAHPASEQDKNAALAYYMYTATGEERYRSLLSAGVVELLGSDDDFNAMMQNTRRRLDLLRKDPDVVELGYDASKIIAEEVDVENIRHCRDAHKLHWIRLSGTMAYTYKSRGYNVSEPVNWPQDSQLLFPVVDEDGQRKFDGYCPSTFY